MQQFVFFAYPPHKKGRETFFKRVITSDIPVIYYDSPHRVMKNLELLQSLDSSKHIILGRELTKLHEEIVRGSVHDVLMYFHEREDTVRGEFVVVVY
jgi:16S rRNA (cytidine1402-2'-O)-methyltransferase